MRNLQQHAGAVAGTRIASARAAMSEVVEDLDALAHDIVRALAFDVDHEADATCVVLVLRRVEALCRRYAAVLMHDHTLWGPRRSFSRYRGDACASDRCRRPRFRPR